MVRRIYKKVIHFQFPFAIDEIHKVFPAGEYTIETEEESIPGSSIVHFRHVETVLIVHPTKGDTGSTHFWAVDPGALDRAIAKDADQCLKVKRRGGTSDMNQKSKLESE